MKRPLRTLIAVALLAAAALAADPSSAPRIVELIFRMVDPSGRGAATTSAHPAPANGISNARSRPLEDSP